MGVAVAPGPSQVAERVVEALEATDASVAGLPGRMAAAVLVALGSSAAEHEQLARDIARLTTWSAPSRRQCTGPF